jgi:hypothetical protein
MSLEKMDSPNCVSEMDVWIFPQSMRPHLGPAFSRVPLDTQPEA